MSEQKPDFTGDLLAWSFVIAMLIMFARWFVA
jgi:hypothetical protein